MTLRYPIFLLLLCGCLPAEGFNLIPVPRSIARGTGEYHLHSPVSVKVTADSEDDRFAAGLLVRELREVHWLDNVLVRYDAEALSWVRQMQVFDDAGREAEATRTLPDAEKLGLFLPVDKGTP